MSERRFPIGVLAVVPVVVGMGVWAFTGQAQVEDPAVLAEQTAQAEASLTPEATATPDWWVDSPPQWTPGPTETPWPTPQTTHGDFHSGAWVRVNAGAGDCLNARNSPSKNEEYTIVNVCLPDGYEGLVSGSVTEADGHFWWHLAGLGYVAEDYLTYLRDFDEADHRLLDLAGQGRVAFLRGNDVWMMDADGSRQTRLVDLPDNDPNSGTYVPAPQDLRWSPDGTMLAYNLSRMNVATSMYTFDLHVFSLADGSEQVFEAVYGGGWSPDGMHMGVIREAQDYVTGIPAILDVQTGAQLVLGSEPLWQEKAPAFNHDGTLLMVDASDPTTGERGLIIYDSTGLEVQRVTFGTDSYYASARWSPTQNRIAMHLSSDGHARYVVYDLASAAIVAEAETPAVSGRAGGGGCGGGDMWRTAWSADGTRVMYLFRFGDTGANGVWAWNVGSGEQRVVPASGADAPVAGPDGALMFSAWGGDESYIFAGITDGGFPRILTNGSSPAWHY